MFSGSSPRGRGTPFPVKVSMGLMRFIPAWAGNTHVFVRQVIRLGGSSPRGRGTQFPVLKLKRLCRFIPAWAGNTTPAYFGALAAAGSSPRGRGTRASLDSDDLNSRFIPAWAGNTRPATVAASAPAVHPRVGGEHVARDHATVSHGGSSPRGRGTLGSAHCRESGYRFIPAWAGNTSGHPHHFRRRPVHPRVGGEHFSRHPGRRSTSGSSPRGRGTHASPDKLSMPIRFIPAWAGNTCCNRGGVFLMAVHPRVGGEHGGDCFATEGAGGSSPRGRGTRTDGADYRRLGRFIPAWAGNTCAEHV